MELLAYLLYAVISVGVTVWVARTLSVNGRVFLVDVFAGNERLADSVNHLLVVGFYLINLGFVSLVLMTGGELATVREVVELLSRKLGLVLLILGLLHLFNIFVFGRVRRSALRSRNAASAAAGAAPNAG
jgi:phosphoglycerol transferase MdoB-like AlkP superfamily enzyme